MQLIVVPVARLIGAALRALVAVALLPLTLVCQAQQRTDFTPMSAPAFVDSAFTYDTLCIQPLLDSASRAALDTVSLDVAEWFMMTTSDGLLPLAPDLMHRYYASELNQKGTSYQFRIMQGYTKSHVLVAHEVMHVVYQTVTGDHSWNVHKEQFFWNCRLMPDQYGVTDANTYNNDPDMADMRLRTERLWK